MSEVWDVLAADPVAYVCSEPETTEPTVAKIVSWMPPNGRVLDLGCGQGRLATAVARRVRSLHVVGVDVSPAMIAAAPSHPRVEYVVTDGHDLPGGMFDGAWSVLVFQHLEPQVIHDYVARLTQQVRPGAPVLVQWVPGDHHVGLDQRHTTESMLTMFTRDDWRVHLVEFDVHPDWAWLYATRRS